MSVKFNLISDSTCDLSVEESQRMGISIIPFSYTEAGKPDGGFHGVDDQFQSRTPHEFYQAIRDGASPMTSQPSPLAFDEAFRAALDTGLPSVVFSISSGLSGGYNGAVGALDRLKEELGKDDLPIYIIDSGMATVPMRLLIEEAVRMRDEGAEAKEVYDWAMEARFFVQTLFMVDSLDTLQRGGRIPKSVAFVAGTLDAKPLLNVGTDGTLGFVGVTRGRTKGLKRLAKFYTEERDDSAYGPIVSVGGADCPEEVDRLIEMLKKANPDARIIVSNIGPTIGCHVGPGMVACSFWGADRRLGKSKSRK